MRRVGQESAERIVIHAAVGAQLFQNVVLHAFESEAEFDGVGPVRIKGVIVKLDGIKGMLELVEATQTESSSDAGDRDLRGTNGARGNRQGCVCGDGVAGDRGVDVADQAAESRAEGICESRTENMVFFSVGNLRGGEDFGNLVTEGFRLLLGTGVEK